MEEVKYSKVGAGAVPEALESSNKARSRGWRSVVKKVASGGGCMRRRGKLVGAIISRTRRLVLLCGCGSLQLEKKAYGISSLSSPDIAESNNLNFYYDILGYTKNFDDGKWQQEEADFYSCRSFSRRFVQVRVQGDLEPL